MKHFFLFSVFLLLLVGPSSAQQWSWEWNEFTPGGSGVDSLLGTINDVLTLDGESSPRLIHVRSEEPGFTMIQDANPDPGIREWTSRHYDADLHYSHSFTRYARHLRAEGNQIRRLDTGQFHQDTLRTYLMDPTLDDEIWTLDEDHVLIGDGDEFEENATLGDFDGDGQFDYAVVAWTPSNQYIVLVAFDGGAGDTLHIQLDYTGTYFGSSGLYALDIDGDNQDELFAFGYGAQMHGTEWDYRTCYTAVTPDSLLSQELGNTSCFYFGDIDGDGNADLLSNDDRTLVSGELADLSSLNFTTEDAWSPPFQTWLPLEFDDAGHTTTFLSCTAEEIKNNFYSGSPLGRTTYQFWSMAVPMQRYDVIGEPFDAPSASVTMHPVGDQGEQGIFLAAPFHYIDTDMYGYWTSARQVSTPDHPEHPLVPFYATETGGQESADVVGYGDLDGDGTLERIVVRSETNQIDSYHLDGTTWVEGSGWSWPAGAPTPDNHMVVADLDGNGTPDLLYRNNHALICLRGSDGAIHWEHALPFEGLEAAPPAHMPYSVADMNGDGINDLYFGGNRLLINSSSNGVRPGRQSVHPEQFQITTIAPNPFNPSTTITLEVPRAGHLRVAVYDLLGRQVRTLHDGPSTPGQMKFLFDGSGLASGTYVVEASIDNTNSSLRKVVLLK